MPLASPSRRLQSPGGLCLRDFELGRRIGEGQFGRVYLARERRSHFIVALKAIKKVHLVGQGLEPQLQREIENQGNVRHVNVLRLYAWFHDTRHVYLVLEFCEKGEVFGLLSAQGTFPQPVAAWFIRCVAAALQHLHGKHVIHRDLKPENLLVDHHGVVKVADFGWSVHHLGGRRTTFCGTLDYLPPEQVGQRAHDQRVDVWCIGVLCFEFLAGRAPFQNADADATTRDIARLHYSFPADFPPLAQDFVRKILVDDPARRLTIPQMLAHPWLQQWALAPAVNPELRALLNLDPRACRPAPSAP